MGESLLDTKIIQKICDSVEGLEILSELKKGGQKIVYKASLTGTKEIVFKVIKPASEMEKNRALREIQITADLCSEFFPKMFHFGESSNESGNYIYMLEEKIPGSYLRDFIETHENKIPNLEETKRTIGSVLNALAITESLNLVHRDIKPENIMISKNRIVLIDFGIARHLNLSSLTDTSAFFGPMTPGYAPPEQIKNEKRKISIRTDFFSMGVVFYELLAGVNPFFLNAKHPQQALQNVLRVTPPLITSYGYHPSINSFLQQCLEKQTHRRFPNTKTAIECFNEIVWEVQ